MLLTWATPWENVDNGSAGLLLQESNCVEVGAKGVGKKGSLGLDSAAFVYTMARRRGPGLRSTVRYESVPTYESTQRYGRRQQVSPCIQAGHE